MNIMDLTKELELSSDPKPVTRKKRAFKSESVCDILKACYDSDVAKFSYDGLTVEFFGKDQPTEHKQSQPVQVQIQQSNNIETKDKIVSLGETVDEHLDQLEIEDPFAAEQFATSETSVAERSSALEVE